jgi:antitoxin CcdA
MQSTTAATPSQKSSTSGKRATNLSLSVDVLENAKRLDINISQVCDNHLREVVRLAQARKWQEEHAEFIAAYNQIIEAEGLPLDEWKSF